MSLDGLFFCILDGPTRAIYCRCQHAVIANSLVRTNVCKRFLVQVVLSLCTYHSLSISSAFIS
uniref:Uncharacterized protein n=1 Tax=Arundo donax TaxID=35708 RepID=A0A0A9CBZ3_ARUDO